MKKEILNEINRNLELMNVPKKSQLDEIFITESNLLTESSILKKILKNIRDAFPASTSKVAGTGVDEFLVGTRKVTEDFFNSYKALLDDFATNWPRFTSNPKYMSELASILRSNESIVNSFYEDLFTDLILSQRKENPPSFLSETGFYKLLKKKELRKTQLGEDFDLENELETLLPDPFERSLLSPKITKNYSDYKKGKFQSTVHPKDPNAPIRRLSDRQRKSLVSFLGRSTKYWPDMIMALKQSAGKVRKNIEALANGFTDEIVGKSPEEIKLLTQAYSVKIARELEKLNTNFQDAAIDLMEEENLPSEILITLRNDPDEFFRSFRESVQYASKIGNEQVTTYLETAMETLESNAREVVNFFNNLKKGKFLEASKSLLPTRDLGTWFFTQQWAGLNKLYKLCIKYSCKQNTRKFLGHAWVATTMSSIFGWLIHGGLMTAYETLIKGFWNAGPASFIDGLCELVQKAALSKGINVGDGSGCNNLYAIKADYIKGNEGMLWYFMKAAGNELFDSAFTSEKAGLGTIIEGVIRLIPIANYLVSIPNSVFGQLLETGAIGNPKWWWGIFDTESTDPPQDPQKEYEDAMKDVKEVSPAGTDTSGFKPNWQ